ncbi:hypothetical protein ACFOJE_01575 [Azotobacter bryophylli]|uniref:Uncharacterized protein n=1 Tax=Azotobacter bryophylli TaxID=1986537 RepID=A0ABV7APE1_9GAMM
MNTTQHATTRCPVYLHPACASSPNTIRRIQARTGLLVIAGKSRKAPTLARPTDDFGPWGGDAA